MEYVIPACYRLFMSAHVDSASLGPRQADDATSLAIASLAARPSRLSVGVVDLLVDRIVSGQHPAGGLLPPGPVLCQFFDVSRSVVREAVKALEQKGLVTVRQGHGTVVADPAEWNLLDAAVMAAAVRHDDRGEVIDGLVAVRAALEADMAAHAATRVGDDGIERLKALVGELARSVELPARYSALDTQFHDEVMRMSRNRLARAVVRSIHDQARSDAGYNDPHPAIVRMAHRGHEAILERIAARDPEGAAEVMREHIASTWQRKRAAATSSETSRPS
jgi:DNA-binding FadR family transcriptional regulator